MTNPIALAAIIAGILAANVAHAANVAAQTVNERSGVTVADTTPRDPTKKYACSLPGLKAVYPCNEAEFKKNPGYRVNDIKSRADKARVTQEMQAEARAYKKMQEDRKRHTPTIEHCFVKNGALVCKPA